jgi:peptidoglycan/xylan/chitin deacetylase (PgdA/CDA1 family)
MVTPQLLTAHLDALHDTGYTAVSIDRVVAARDGSASLPSRPYAVTFDDAFADFVRAIPILQARDVPATLFVPTAHLGGTGRWLEGTGEQDRAVMTADEVAALPAAGVSVGSHGHTHAMLDLLEATMLTHELAHSATMLSDIVGGPVRAVAYPHGYNGRRVRRHAIEAGYSYGLGVDHRLHQPNDDRYSLARVIVYGATTPDELLANVAGRNLRRRPVKSCAAVASWGWRMIRRATAASGQRRLAAWGTAQR